MLCFDSCYQVETWRDGKCNKYVISVDGGDSAFSVVEHTITDKSGSGTRLTVKAVKKMPRDVYKRQAKGQAPLETPDNKTG